MNHSFELEKGKLFVSGLHWQALSGGPSEVKAEVEKLAALEGFDLAVWRVSSVQQVGFADTKKGFKAGMMSAAAVVSKTIDEEEDVRDFLCGIPLPDGRYLYVAQSEGVILPDGDSIGTAEEVRGRMLADMSVGKDWAKIYAPLAWGMQGAAERSFEDFLPQKNGKIDYRHKWWVLKPIKTSIRSVAKIVLPIAALSILIGAGMVSYKRWQIAKANAEAAAAAAAMATESFHRSCAHVKSSLIAKWVTNRPIGFSMISFSVFGGSMAKCRVTTNALRIVVLFKPRSTVSTRTIALCSFRSE